MKLRVDLICKKCKHAFKLATEYPIPEENKVCPECGSESVRQSLASYLRNGPVLDPTWADRGACRSYG